MKSYIKNILISLDQFLNTLFGGHPDETISSAVGRKCQKDIWWAKPIRLLIDAIFLVLTGEKDHCYNSIEINIKKKV